MKIPAIIYEDKNLMVLDKPAGMVVNRAETTRGVPTLQDWVEDYLRVGASSSLALENSLTSQSFVRSNIQASRESKSPPFLNKEFVTRSGIVHRLDKETSGIILVARDPETFHELQKQFKEGRVEKTYVALVHGKVVPEEGEITIPLGRLPWNRMRFGILPGGREAKTLYKVISNFKFQISNIKSKILTKEELSLVEVYPQTGRTHQIRVHFQYIGCPIFADELYAGRKISRADRKLLPRHFLHASKIRFTHPKTGQSVEFESKLPADLSDFLSTLE